MNKNLYDTVVKNDYSVNSGAYAVVDQNIKMELDELGEYRPVAKDPKKPIDWSNPELLKVCSMSDQSPNEDDISQELFSKQKGVNYDPVIGYYTNLYAGHVEVGDFRKKASSGGMATWILEQLLTSKDIDGIIHVKPGSKSGPMFEYSISTSVKQLRSGAKSRYYPVEFSGALNKIKKLKGNYAVVGIPSFIMEVRLLAKQDRLLKQRIKYTVGLICGHQKTTKYAENLAWQKGIKSKDIKSINFRKKVDQRSAIDYDTEITGSINGKEVKISEPSNSFFACGWGEGYFKANFSDFVDDAFNETADVVLGDAWLPEYIQDSQGNNVVIVRNSKINKIIQSGIKTGQLKLDVVSLEKIKDSQRGLIHHYRDELPYRLRKKDKAGIWRPQKRVEASTKISLTKRRVQDMRQKIMNQSKRLYRQAELKDDWSYFQKRLEPMIKKYRLTYRFANLKKKLGKLRSKLQ
ncbi:coenzyme F420 hydrogenase [Candidatus Saccharibacteria bacterium]|nr:MAG: coenzyme F420 hydrogenase [Candidatus Saccharibacteria bacterium]